MSVPDHTHAHAASLDLAEAARDFLYRPGRIAGTREAIVRPNYLIVYRAGDRFVDVLRILHAALQYP